MRKSIRKYTLKRILRRILMQFIRNRFWITGGHRARLASIAGVDFKNPKTCFVGMNVVFDDLHPEGIHVGDGTFITNGVSIITHYLDDRYDYFNMIKGDVYIGNSVFIGMHTIIAKPVKIGDNTIVAAGSVVISDLDSNAIYAGNPAKKIKDRSQSSEKALKC